MVLRNATTGTILATRVQRARTPWRRMIGWLGRSTVSPDEGLLFERCAEIHTVGMRTPIDVLFLDRSWCVRDVVPRAEPGRLRVGRAGAGSVLEMGPGFLQLHGVVPGDHLDLAAT